MHKYNFGWSTFNLFVILRFRLELRWPSDVNREATISTIALFATVGSISFCHTKSALAR